MKGFNGEEPFSAVERPGNDTMADLASVQREIKKMALLVPASLIFRMDEKLSDSSNPSAYKETEMEKKRLMLYALYALGRPRETQNPPNARKMLALFETEGESQMSDRAQKRTDRLTPERASNRIVLGGHLPRIQHHPCVCLAAVSPAVP